jgi:propionyl-CoA synthetase
MAKIADGEEFAMPATIDDPAILDELRAAMAPLGYGASKAAAG